MAQPGCCQRGWRDKGREDGRTSDIWDFLNQEPSRTEFFASEAYGTLVEGQEGSYPVWTLTLGNSEEQKPKKGLCFVDQERSLERQELVKLLVCPGVRMQSLCLSGCRPNGSLGGCGLLNFRPAGLRSAKAG